MVGIVLNSLLPFLLLFFSFGVQAKLKVCSDRDIIEKIGSENFPREMLSCAKELGSYNLGYKDKIVAVLLDKEVNGKIFYFSYPRIHQIKFFNYVDGKLESTYKYEKIKNGGQESVTIDNLKTKKSKIIALLRTESSLQVPYLTFNSREKFQKFLKEELLFEGLWFGIMIFTAFISLVIYYIKRNKEVLYFFIHLSALVIAQSAFSGFFFSYFSFLPDYFLRRSIILVLCLMVYGSVGLIYQNFKRSIGWKVIEFYKYNNYLAILIFITTLVFYNQVTIKLTSYMMLLFSVSTLIVCIMALKRRYENALILLTSFSFFLLSTLAFTLKDLGFIGINEIILDNIVKVGFFAEIMLIGIVILRTLLKEQKTLEEAVINKKISLSAKAIKHDVKSPLSSLGYLLKMVNKKLNENERVIANESLNRIEDIINTLTSTNESGNRDHISYTHLFSLVSMSVSGKRIEHKNRKGIEINLVNYLEYGVFIACNRSLFSRSLSNLINNSIEASQQGTTNKINIKLSNDKESCYLEITDNGIGIRKENIRKVTQRGESINKLNGQGIGLAIVDEFVRISGGELEIQSEYGLGTKIIIKLPKVETPHWLEKELNIKQRKICIVDDDDSIFSVWKELFLPYDVELIHIKRSYDFDNWINNKDINNYYFLFDFTLINSELDGLALISKYNLKQNSTLVTSSDSDVTLQNRALKCGVKIIPKESARFIKIELKDTTRELILIDDDLFLHKIWTFASEQSKSSLTCYSSIKNFLNNSEKHLKSADIYIDENISEIEKGSIDSFKIYERGFKNIYLNSAMEVENIPYWIKSITNKDFPLY